jgi:hypothetical protein
MKASKLKRLVHQLVAAENTIRHSTDKREIELAEKKIEEITEICLKDDIDTLFYLDAMAQKILDEKF